jgi:aspartate aminotransferase
MLVVGSETYTCASAPIQYAAVTAFDFSDEITDYLMHVRRIFSQIGTQSYEILNKAGFHVHAPSGAFYLFPSIKEKLGKKYGNKVKTDMELCEILLRDTGVAVLPGSEFGRSPKEMTFRLAYVNFDGTRALEASRKIGLNRDLPSTFPGEYASETCRAMNLLADWAIGLES